MCSGRNTEISRCICDSFENFQLLCVNASFIRSVESIIDLIVRLDFDRSDFLNYIRNDLIASLIAKSHAPNPKAADIVCEF